MFKKVLSFLIFLTFSVSAQGQSFYEIDPLDKMPILRKPVSSKHGAAPIEQRGPEFRKFLAASVRIDIPGGAGSGTIIYYDSQNNKAYVASCGHLFNRGIMSEEEAKRKKLKVKVVAYYQNDVKLDKPKSYDADVCFYSYVSGQDTSLISFTPDWVPEYFPIAPKTFAYEKGKHYHSLGCDGAKEVAHYDIEVIGISGNDLVTYKNSPRPGRSGGGLMDDEGYYIATCWGTEFKDGSGRGFFTPLSVIHNFWGQQGSYKFLLDQKPGSSLAKKIPVLDRNNPAKKYGPDYILFPK